MDGVTVIREFNRLFATDDRTCLCGGADEPLYLPPTAATPAKIVFKEDFVASALHEVAHWCIASRQRRALPDYGYWYECERTVGSQARFEAVEVAPQALEWVLSVAAGLPFRVSTDNPFPAAVDRFREQVRDAARARITAGLPLRAERFAQALASVSGTGRHYLAPVCYEELPRWP
jgi:elongation factor P hydroxylase